MADLTPKPFVKLSKSLAKRIGVAAIVAVIAASTFASLDAYAKRLGGGRTVGRSTQTTPNAPASPRPPAQQSTQQSAQPSQAQRAQPAPSPRSRWLGPIAGLAAGLGIAALLSHFGLGGAFASAMANVIVIALLAMAGIWLFRKLTSRGRRNAAHPYGAAGMGSVGSMGNMGSVTGGAPLDRQLFGGNRMQAGGVDAHGGVMGTSVPAAGAASLPDFDADAFLHHAKLNFVRLQGAWDEGNLADIREFTTPEMFAELKGDIDARGGESNRTDVVQLNAELLGVEDRGTEYLASVRFSGLIRESAGESAGASAEPFSEVWNLSKAARKGEGWLLAGIQQGALH
jgi:predicted lipid-binding transport protein (Tim44 family)